MSNGRSKSCVFCGEAPPAVKMTNEHVLRNWFRQHMSGPDTRLRHRSWWMDEATGTRQVDHRDVGLNPWEVTVKRVCAPCNNGFLNDEIEKPIETTLLRLMRGQLTRLDPEDQKLIAIWAWKTSLVRALADSGPTTIPDSDFRYLRERIEPPSHVRVWLGSCEAPEDTWTRHSRFTIAQGPVGPSHGYITTLALGNLLLFIWSGPEEFLALVEGSIWPALDVKVAQVARVIWPVQDTIRWPSLPRMYQYEFHALTDQILQYALNTADVGGI
ncbi:Uncharacterised protein [Rhodococcus gordoniae]|uniref:HNH endonuclease n=2 Tax=Rhodococcus gordoniae TaxID=223392 RepID=A0A379M2S6_9NOCA|nr:Uncharacterised protein [Rhodococcus gordoniae]